MCSYFYVFNTRLGLLLIELQPSMHGGDKLLVLLRCNGSPDCLDSSLHLLVTTLKMYNYKNNPEVKIITDKSYILRFQQTEKLRKKIIKSQNSTCCSHNLSPQMLDLFKFSVPVCKKNGLLNKIPNQISHIILLLPTFSPYEHHDLALITAYCYWWCGHSPELPVAADGRVGSLPWYETQAESETSCLQLQVLHPPDSCLKKRERDHNI